MPYVFAGKLLCDTDGELLKARLLREDALLPLERRQFPDGEPTEIVGRELFAEAIYATTTRRRGREVNEHKPVNVYSSEIWPIYVRPVSEDYIEAALRLAPNDVEDFFKLDKHLIHCCMDARCQSPNRVRHEGDVFGELLTKPLDDISLREVIHTLDARVLRVDALDELTGHAIQPAATQRELAFSEPEATNSYVRVAALRAYWESLRPHGTSTEVITDDQKTAELIGFEDAWRAEPFERQRSFICSLTLLGAQRLKRNEDPVPPLTEEALDDAHGWGGALYFGRWYKGSPDWFNERGTGDTFTAVLSGYDSTKHYLYDDDTDTYWKLVGNEGGERERECPLNREDRGDGEENVVTPEDASRSNDTCVWCEANLGEEHSSLYSDYLGEIVYRQLEEFTYENGLDGGWVHGEDWEEIQLLDKDNPHRTKRRPMWSSRAPRRPPPIDMRPETAQTLATHRSQQSVVHTDIEARLRQEMERAGIARSRAPSLMPEPAREAEGESRDRFAIIRDELAATPSKRRRFKYSGKARRYAAAVTERIVGLKACTVLDFEEYLWDTQAAWLEYGRLVDALKAAKEADTWATLTAAQKRAAGEIPKRHLAAHTFGRSIAPDICGTVVAAEIQSPRKLVLLVKLREPFIRRAGASDGREYSFVPIRYDIDDPERNLVRLSRPYREAVPVRQLDIDPPEVKYTAAQRRESAAIIKRLLARRVRFEQAANVLVANEPRVEPPVAGYARAGRVRAGWTGTIVEVVPDAGGGYFSVWVRLDREITAEDPFADSSPRFVLCSYLKTGRGHSGTGFTLWLVYSSLGGQQGRLRFLKGKGELVEQPESKRLIDMDDSSPAGKADILPLDALDEQPESKRLIELDGIAEQFRRPFWKW